MIPWGLQADGALPMPWILRRRSLSLVLLPVNTINYKLQLVLYVLDSTKTTTTTGAPTGEYYKLVITISIMSWILRRRPLPPVLLPVRQTNHNNGTLLIINLNQYYIPWLVRGRPLPLVLLPVSIN